MQGKDILFPHKPGEYRVIGKKRHIKVGSHSWLPNRRKETFKPVEGRKVSLMDRWILQKD